MTVEKESMYVKTCKELFPPEKGWLMQEVRKRQRTAMEV